MSQTEITTNEEEVVDIAGDGHGISERESLIQTSTEIHEPAEGDLLGQFGLNGTLFVAQLINFLIVLIVLWRFAYKPLMKLMTDRTEKIEKGLKHADEMEQRINELENEKEEVMSAARNEAKEIVTQAAVMAESKRVEAVANAKSEVEKVVATGKTQLVAQKEQMMSEAKEELATMLVSAVKKVAGDSVDIAKAEASATSAIEEASKKL